MAELFNVNGEMNAGSVREALERIVQYASILPNAPSNTAIAQPPTMTTELREELIRKALQTQEGKIALGQAMANPIRRNLDYAGVGRKALVVDPLPQGALPVYDQSWSPALAMTR